MRFIFATAVASAMNAATVSAVSCQSYCNDVSDCRNDPHAHGSYCKVDHDPQVCFGLYWADEAETEMCFQPNASGACPETNPVRCPEVTDVCQDVCASTEGCLGDKHGSYCKEWQSIPVCFGLYYTDATKTATCFQPADPSCPETYPVGCEAAPVSSSSTPAPPLAAAVLTTAKPVVAAAGTTTVKTTLPSVAPRPHAPSGATASLPTTAKPVPVTTTTTKAPTTTAAPVLPHVGKYDGTAMRGMLKMTVTVTAATMDITMALAGSNFSGSALPYKLTGNQLVLVDHANLTTFLKQFASMGLKASDITITYDAAADTLSGSFKGVKITGTKTA